MLAESRGKIYPRKQCERCFNATNRLTYARKKPAHVLPQLPLPLALPTSSLSPGRDTGSTATQVVAFSAPETPVSPSSTPELVSLPDSTAATPRASIMESSDT